MKDNTVDPALIDFALRWHHYDDDAGDDAGDEEIYPTFGISPGDYRRRLWYALNLPNAPAIDEHTRTRLLAYARRYTTAASSPPHIGAAPMKQKTRHRPALRAAVQAASSSNGIAGADQGWTHIVHWTLRKAGQTKRTVTTDN